MHITTDLLHLCEHWHTFPQICDVAKSGSDFNFHVQCHNYCRATLKLEFNHGNQSKGDIEQLMNNTWPRATGTVDLGFVLGFERLSIIIFRSPCINNIHYISGGICNTTEMVDTL